MDTGCACNSRLNLVRLFVNPPHPVRARTPPWGCLCTPVRPVVSAPVRACLCALPVVYLVAPWLSTLVPPWCAWSTWFSLVPWCAQCSPWCALSLVPLPGCYLVHLVRLSGALASFALGACLRLCVFPALPWALPGLPGALASFAPACPFCLWLPSGLRRPAPALPYAGRLARCGIAAALPRFSRGSVTIVCYNQISALQGIAYNLSSMV